MITKNKLDQTPNSNNSVDAVDLNKVLEEQLERSCWENTELLRERDEQD